MSALDRLVGADASLYKATWGTALAGSGTLASGTWYRVSTISGTTNYQTYYEVGDLILGNGQSVTAGYTLVPATFSLVEDCNSFEISFARDEVEVTVLSDDVKKYRPGKTDMSGTIRGINFISQMKTAGSFLNRFIRTVSATAANASTFNPLYETELYGQFYVQDNTTTSGETHGFLFGQIEMYGYTIGATIADAQSWESGIRFIGADPIMYFKANA